MAAARRRPFMRRLIPLVIALSLTSAAEAQQVFRAGGFEMALDGRGAIVGLTDLKAGRNYAAAGQPGSLIRVRTVDGAELPPTAVRVSKGRLTFTFDGGIELIVGVASKPGYLRFELIKAAPPERIDAVLWGPIRTTIKETIG